MRFFLVVFRLMLRVVVGSGGVFLGCLSVPCVACGDYMKVTIQCRNVMNHMHLIMVQYGRILL
jgi:hypothetical protein